jgi:RNA-directed DNA polymerase
VEQVLRRVGGLLETLLSFPHMYAAFCRARRGTHTEEMRAFAMHVEERLWELIAQMREGTYAPCPYRYFTIFEPKPRQISVAAFRDRVVHHALVGLLEPIWEKRFISDSYATRKDKGVHQAIVRAQQGVRAHPYFLKMDVRSYFPSMDHDVLMHRIERVVKDRGVLSLCARIVSCGGDGIGLPIGNLTSQFFANVYLDPFDHWVKERLRIRHYVRYMDDFVLFGDDRKRLCALRDEVRAKMRDEFRLTIKDEVTHINSRSHGLPFLGVRIFPAYIRHQRTHFMRSYRKLVAAVRVCETDPRARARIDSLCASLRVWGGHFLRERLLIDAMRALPEHARPEWVRD